MDKRKSAVVPNTDTSKNAIKANKPEGQMNTGLPSQAKTELQHHQQQQRIAALLRANKQLRKSERAKEKLNLLLAHKVIKRTTQYAFISHINQSIVHTSNEETLFRKSCRIACEIGKFKMAWIGLFDSSKKHINIVQQSGMLAEDVILFTNAPCRRRGPHDLVMHTGSYYICNDINACPDLEKWKPFTTKHAIHSFIVLPLRRLGNIIGTFNLYSSEIGFFDQEEIALLLEVSGDISFALGLFEKEKKHKATEDLILKNEKRFRALVENGADAVAILSKNGQLKYVSPSIQRILGYTDEEIIKLTLINLMHPDDLGSLSSVWGKVLESKGIPIQGHTGRMRHKDGTWKWLEATVTNMLHDPAINGIVDNFRDVTPSIELTLQREFDENNMNALINSTEDLMWSVSTDFKFITFNRAFFNFAKQILQKELTIGDSAFWDELTENQMNRYKLHYMRAFSGESFTEVEYLKQPNESWTQISYYPIKIGDKIIGSACYSRDITNLKKAEENLLHSQAKLNEAQTLAHMGSWELDFKTNLLQLSAESCRIFDSCDENNQLTFAAWSKLIHPGDRARVLKIIKEAKNSLSDISYQHRIISKNGSIRHIYSESKFVFDSKDKPTGLYGILQDITERQLAEVEREKITADILRRNKDLEQFSYIVSHNLRTPVANIIGLSELVTNEQLEPEIKNQVMEGISESVKKLDEVITDLNYILQAKQHISQEKESVRFSKVITDVTKSIHTLIEKENAVVVYNFDEAGKLRTIKSYLHSIFYNLINNSLKYRREAVAPLIEITTRRQKNKIILIFKDNGMGIDLVNNGADVFGMYKRFHPQIPDGKGMGLYMVKAQVESIGAHIHIQSEINKGTVFTIEFPTS